MTRSVSTWQVLRQDSPARAGAWLVLALAAAHVVVTVALGPDPDRSLVAPLGGVAAGLGLVGWRLQHFRALFRRGVPTQGVVVDATFRRGAGRVWFDHHHGGPTRTWSPLADTPEARALRPGDRVDLLVHPDRPDVVCPPALFAATPR